MGNIFTAETCRKDYRKYGYIKVFYVKRCSEENSNGYIPKKAEVFSQKEIILFIDEAPDEIYLVYKVSKIKVLLYLCSYC